MKKFFESIGIIALVFCSFWYTEKTTTVMKENDEMMIQIKMSKSEEKIEVVEASIINDTMIPGIHGKEIDTEKSYIKMKEIGYFDPSFFVYKDVKPQIVMEHHFDKYIISGNPQKNYISLLFLIERNTREEQVETLLSILEKKNKKVDFFVDGYFLEEHNDLMYKIIKNGHKLRNLSYDYDYTNASFLWLDAVLKKLNHDKTNFCYVLKENKQALEVCSMYKNHVIIPSYVIEKEGYLTLKKNIDSGNLISIKINSNVLKELPIMMDYIKSKGYQSKLLEEHLSE